MLSYILKRRGWRFWPDENPPCINVPEPEQVTWLDHILVPIMVFYYKIRFGIKEWIIL